MSFTVFTEPNGTRTDLRQGTRTCMSFSSLGAFLDSDAVQEMQPVTLRQVAAMTTPAGAVVAFAMTSPPAGWLKCNGQQISRTTYRALFLAIGTSFGAGDGFNTFNLPDLRGEFIRGWDEGRGADTGRVFGSWQADEFRSHNHTFNFRNVTNNSGSGGIDDAGGGWVVYDTNYSGGTETRPRNTAFSAMLKF